MNDEAVNVAASEAVIEDIEAMIRRVGADMLEASASDLAAFATRLSAQFIFAAQTDNAAIRASVERQTRLLAEAQRVRATDAAWATFYTVITEATSVAIGVATRLITSGAVRIAP